LAVAGGEADFDVEAAARLCVGGEGGAVGGGDRVHDREAESEAVALVGAVGAEALEGPEEPLVVTSMRPCGWL
jgi:hypothetical protein